MPNYNIEDWDGTVSKHRATACFAPHISAFERYKRLSIYTFPVSANVPTEAYIMRVYDNYGPKPPFMPGVPDARARFANYLSAFIPGVSFKPIAPIKVYKQKVEEWRMERESNTSPSPTMFRVFMNMVRYTWEHQLFFSIPAFCLKYYTPDMTPLEAFNLCLLAHYRSDMTSGHAMNSYYNRSRPFTQAEYEEQLRSPQNHDTSCLFNRPGKQPSSLEADIQAVSLALRDNFETDVPPLDLLLSRWRDDK